MYKKPASKRQATRSTVVLASLYKRASSNEMGDDGDRKQKANFELVTAI